MCITRPLKIVSHPSTQRTTCRWATLRLITMTSLPVANNVHYTDCIHMWQSRVEIEHYSVAYFERITAFKALYM